MIAVTTCRPRADCPAEIVQNQGLAEVSWNLVFTKVHRFDQLAPPTVSDMMRVCADQEGWSCIINADIIVDRKFRQVESLLLALNAKCAFSLRYQPNLSDMGLDIFCGVPEVWRLAAAQVPKHFLMGHILWDTWLLQFFAAYYDRDCYDFTPCRVIFHTPHSHRGDQSMTKPENDPYLDRFVWPGKPLRI